MPHRSAVAVMVRPFYKDMDSNIDLEDNCWHLIIMTEDDLRSLLTMIKGAGLLERRTFDGVKRQIEKILNI